MERLLLFDAGSIFTLVRELRGEAPEKLAEGSTIALAYYELGNALWSGCFLLKRISREEAEKSLRALFRIVQVMFVVLLEDAGSVVLKRACEQKITYYDSAYAADAFKFKRILVADDEKLAKAAEGSGVKTLTSRDFIR